MIFHPGEQSTLAGDVVFTGKGLHTGEMCSLEVHPAEAGTGVVFCSCGSSIPAAPSSVVDTSRGTTLGVNGARVVCVEHLLSAFAGCGIDNAICEVQGPELPALDGSARDYVSEFRRMGLERQGRERRTYEMSGVESWSAGPSFLMASPSSAFEARYLLRYDHPLIGLQFGTFAGESDSFAANIAPARTFGLISEAEQLRKMGLALGAGPDNAVVVHDDHVQPELRFPDEFVRHKLLDMIGDLALIGGALSGTVFGIATGHRANVEMARRIRKE